MDQIMEILLRPSGDQLSSSGTGTPLGKLIISDYVRTKSPSHDLTDEAQIGGGTSDEAETEAGAAEGAESSPRLGFLGRLYST